MDLGHVVVQSRPLTLSDGVAVQFGASMSAARRHLGLDVNLRAVSGSRCTGQDSRGFEMLAELFSRLLSRP